MAILATSGSSLSLLKESVIGTTPGTPSFKEINSISDTLEGTKSTEVSSSIRADRQKSDLTTVQNDVGGDINMQLDVIHQEELLQHLMLTDASEPSERPTLVPSTTLAVDQGDKKYTAGVDTDLFSGLRKGQKVVFSGFTDTDSNGEKTVASVNAAGSELTVEESVGADEAGDAGHTVTWKNYINGSKKPTLNSYTIMKQYNFASELYHYFRGMIPSSLSFSLDPNSLVDLTMGWVGLTDTLTDTKLAGQTLVDVGTENLFATGDSLDITATNLGSGRVYSANLSIDNQINLARSAVDTDAIDQAAFTLNLTGGLTLYFEDKASYDAFANETEFELTFRFTDTSTAIIYLPRCKIASWSLPRPGQDQFLFVEMEWEALNSREHGYTANVAYV